MSNLPKDFIIVSGGAPGVDSFAEHYAKLLGLECEIYTAQWKDENGKFDKAAGMKRNKVIVDNCDAVVAFWDGKSNGTLGTIKLAILAEKVVKIYPDKKG